MTLEAAPAAELRREAAASCNCYRTTERCWRITLKSLCLSMGRIDTHRRLQTCAVPLRQTAPRRYVGSEVGLLRRIILHRLDLELWQLTPRNKDALLFDDALTERGVAVLYLRDLRQETIEDVAVRHDVLEGTLGTARLESRSGRRCANGLIACPPALWQPG